MQKQLNSTEMYEALLSVRPRCKFTWPAWTWAKPAWGTQTPHHAKLSIMGILFGMTMHFILEMIKALGWQFSLADDKIGL